MSNNKLLIHVESDIIENSIILGTRTILVHFSTFGLRPRKVDCTVLE